MNGMGTIKILPDHLVNQIAAGEVVERPAAVVKELLENSLDAGASRIEVEFRRGGKEFIRVEDNGSGMTEEDAVQCLKRHATSKIQSFDELLDLHTFGFRGEAIPSIVSVARVTIKTRHTSQPHGTELLLDAGQLIHQRACGMPVGTRIEVEHLFKNVPARKKFLKSDVTESAQIATLVRLYAIAHPGIAFSLIENGREVFKSPPCASIRDRIHEVWSKQLECIPLSFKDDWIEISGSIAFPHHSKATRQEIILFVNQRPIDNRTLKMGIIEAYRPFLPQGRYPVAFVFIRIDPHLMDVNVHPTKREVRFTEEFKVKNVLQQTLTQALKTAMQTETVGSHASAFSAYNLQNATIPPDRFFWENTVFSGKEAPATHFPSAPTPYSQQISYSLPTSSEQETQTPYWRLIGLLKPPYALFESPAGLLLFNCKAAYQRIFYDNILKTLSEQKLSSQSLLTPIPLELDALSSKHLTENTAFLNEHCGFVIQPFGRHCFRIEAVPTWVAKGGEKAFIDDFLEVVRNEGITPNKSLGKERLALLILKHEPIPAFTDKTAVEKLAQDLMECENPLVCPRGYTIFYEIALTEIDRRLGRSSASEAKQKNEF